MKIDRSPSLIFSAVIIIGGLFAVFASNGSMEKSRPPLPDDYGEEEIVFKGSQLRTFSLGMNGLIADYYWMKSLQYLGGKLAAKPDIRININDLREFEPTSLYPLLENAVDFDPQFFGVYDFGAVVLPAIDPAFAIKLIEKGIENNPNEWRLYNHLGYIHWRAKDYQKASDAYSAASKIDGAPELMSYMVAKMESDAGSRTTARAIYQQMYDDAADTSTREAAKLFLQKLDALEEIEAMNKVLIASKRNGSECVNELSQIFPALSKLRFENDRQFRIDKNNRIIDPGGAPFILNRQLCTVELDPKTTKLPLE